MPEMSSEDVLLGVQFLPRVCWHFFSMISQFVLLNGVWNSYLNLSVSLRRFLIGDMIPQVLEMVDVTYL